MDVVKQKVAPAPVYRSRKAQGAVALAALALVAAWQFMQPSGAETVQRSAILLGTVRQGDLQVQVDGYGVLRSDNQKLLAASAPGTVEALLLKPGAVVKADSIIMRLSNPELEKVLNDEERKLVQEQVALRQLLLNQRLELLNENAKLGELRASYTAARTTREEQQEWADKGYVSKLSFRETQLKETLLSQSSAAAEQRIAQLKLVHAEVAKIQQEKIAAQQARYDIVKEQHAGLSVRAGMDGVLQSLSVELGQSFIPGQKLALVGGQGDLVAMIKVPQAAAQQVKPGQPVQIDTRQDKAAGRVLRVNPAVDNGTIMVEVAFDGAPPASARPELNVDAAILTSTLKNVRYVERPANARANGSAPMFVLDGANRARRTKVRFGADAGRYMQVLGGAEARQQMIVSDMARLAQASSVAIAD